jgi:hypothetical protein
MVAQQSDRSLRLMVTRLGKMRGDDMEAVLNQLDEAQKSRILSLLGEFEGGEGAEANINAPVPFDDIVIPDRISPWLAARINGRADSGEETVDQFIVTPHAQKALRRCAAAMAPQVVAKRRKPSLFDRMWNLFG